MSDDSYVLDAESFVSPEFGSAAIGPRQPVDPDLETLIVRRFTRADLASVVELHVECFPGYLLTALGRSFLRRYYGELCRHDDCCFGATAWGKASGRLASFVVGTSQPREVFRAFYRRNLLALPPIMAGRLVVSRDARRHLIGGVPAIGNALRIAAGRRDSTPVIPDQPAVRLLGIASAPAYRGRAAAAVLEDFERQVRDAGHTRAGASTKPWNLAAIKFFHRHGWATSYESPKGVWFAKQLS